VSLFNVTVAPDTTAPDGSVTVPVRSPETRDCAISDGTVIRAITSRARDPINIFFTVITLLALHLRESVICKNKLRVSENLNARLAAKDDRA
jgi:hypothetical protein